ncbi:hypothetical protein HOY34_12065 [Xinfangfangia sp. D13-10-4-6]|uniref:hypothetical protein n=1 Tax=Pseudogemmobacter hezensis TaxID=2737662 RepID=UPI0015578F1A|nr:hypothetical protein [Pseudogemmobacter hezensis]NPD15934.1 hypothetical protein [Pseudogemmobacter hezensis]
MSEPLTTREIETVLSSIRRLVSAELRPTLKPPTNAAAVDKLLLTPSLRVVPEHPEAEADMPPPGRTAGAGAVAADAIAPGFSEAAAQVFFGEAAPLGQAHYAEGYEDSDFKDADSGFGADPAPAVPHDALTAPSDDPAAGIALASIPVVDWAQDGDPWAGSMTSDASITDGGGDQPVKAQPVKAQADAAQAAGKVAGRISPAPKTARAVSDDPLARAWADRAEAEITEVLNRSAPAAADRDEAHPADRAATPDEDAQATLIDEDFLRDLVRMIIREELAGSLGERITRNVRKLVRHEVNMAIATRDLD